MEIQYIDNSNLAIFNNYKFRKDNKTGYWLCSTLHKRLHIYVYEYYKGKIPKGYEVHHKDHNKDNNNIDNLCLLSKKEHSNLHSKELTEDLRKYYRDNMLNNAIPKAIEWHKSEEGKKWHKQHYLQMKDKLKKVSKYVCINCGAEFESINKKSKFCSNKCKSSYRRKNNKDDEIRYCKLCGREFRTNKYKHSIYCSRNCSKKAMWIKRKEE